MTLFCVFYPNPPLLTRNQVAQMALNALRTEMVTFTGTPGFEANGVTVGYRPEYTPRTGTEAKYHAIEGRTSDVASDANHKGQYYIQLGEQLYDGKLRLDNNATDAFGRPSRYWEFNGKEIGTYMKKELVRAEYTKKVTGDTLYDLLSRNTVINYDVDVFIDGETTAPATSVAGRWFTKNAINRNNDAGVGGTGNGVLTQVFVDDDDKVVTIAIINTYLAIATDNYSEKKDEAKFDVYGINRTTDRIYYRDIVNGQTDKKDMKVTSELFDVKNIQKDDAVLVTVADKEIQTLVPADIIANTKIQSFETGSNDNGGGYTQSSPGNVVVDGTQYDFTAAAEYDPTVMEYYTNASTGTVNLKDKTYNVYLDRYGYAIGVKELEGVNNYVFITGIDLNGSNLGNKNADASAIFLDGTMKTVKVNMGKSEFQTLCNSADDAVLNTWCTYTVNTDGIYTVKEVSHVNMNAGTQAGGAGNENYIPGKNSSNVLLGADNRNNGKLAQYNEFDSANRIKIDDKHISVKGRTTASTNYSRVYGTDNTVYLTVELAELKGAGGNYGIINDVVSVNTGISNVSLEAWTTNEAIAEAEDSKVSGTVGGNITNGVNVPTYSKSKAANGVYSLYNDNGDIIAMVVVGEDAGATKNLVYAHKAATFKEAYDEATSKWTWQRKVIYNGEEIILTEVDDGLSKLGSMLQHNWYQVKYNSDGNVVDVTKVTGNAATGALVEDTDYETDYTEIESTINNGKDTVLYTSLAPQISSENLKMPGRTLFLDTTQTKGFRVATDVKTALIQWNNNDQKTYFESGVDSLRSIVEDLNERHSEVSKQHNYIVSAILEKGVATCVVIYDASSVCDPYTNPDWGTGTATITISGSNITYTVPAGHAVPTTTELRDAVLAKLGETWNPSRGDEFYWDAGTRTYVLKVNGMRYAVTVDDRANNPSVTLDKATLTLNPTTSTGTLTATFNKGHSNLTVSSYAWTSSDTTKATVAGASNVGTVTFVAAGTATITCTATLSDSSTVTVTCVVTCNPPTTTDVTLDNSGNTIDVDAITTELTGTSTAPVKVTVTGGALALDAALTIPANNELVIEQGGITGSSGVTVNGKLTVTAGGVADTTGVTVGATGVANITGNVAKVVDVAAGGSATITGNVTTVADNNGTLDVTGNVTTLTTNAGDMTVSGTVGTLADNTAGTLTIGGAVTTVTAITDGTVVFESTATTVTDIAGGDVTFQGSAEVVGMSGAATLSVEGTAVVTIKPTAALTAAASTTIDIAAGAKVVLNSTGATISVANVTFTGADGATISLSGAATNNITVGTDQLYQNGGSTAETAGDLSADKDYVYDTDKFVATT